MAMAKANKKWEITHIAIRTWPNNTEKKGPVGLQDIHRTHRTQRRWDQLPGN